MQVLWMSKGCSSIAPHDMPCAEGLSLIGLQHSTIMKNAPDLTRASISLYSIFVDVRGSRVHALVV